MGPTKSFQIYFKNKDFSEQNGIYIWYNSLNMQLGRKLYLKGDMQSSSTVDGRNVNISCLVSV